MVHWLLIKMFLRQKKSFKRPGGCQGGLLAGYKALWGGRLGKHEVLYVRRRLYDSCVVAGTWSDTTSLGIEGLRVLVLLGYIGPWHMKAQLGPLGVCTGPCS